MEITLKEALLGFSKKLKHLNGDEIEVRTEPGEVTQPFSWKVIDRWGMPKKGSWSGYGDLHVQFIIKMPAQLTPEQKEVVKEVLGLSLIHI